MKRLSTLLLAALMALLLTACTIKPIVDFTGKPIPSDNFASTHDPTPSQSAEPAPTEPDVLIYPDEDGYAMGYLGDTLRTDFFDMRVDDAYTCYEFDGVTAEEGYKLLVAEVTLYNYTNVTQPMFCTDFEIWWDAQEGESEDDAWDYPVYGETELEDGTSDYFTLSDEQFPIEYQLSIRQEKQGILLYRVPEGSMTFSVVYLEIYEDDSTGNLFEVRFSAPLSMPLAE